MFIPDPGSWFLPIPDPGSRIPDLGSRIQKQQQKRGVKKIWCHTFLCSHKFHKLVYYFSFEVLKKKIWANFQRIIELFTQKIVTKLSKVWVWDPGSEIRDPEKTYSGSRIPDPGVKKAPDPGSGSATLFKSFWYGVLAQRKRWGEGGGCRHDFIHFLSYKFSIYLLHADTGLKDGCRTYYTSDACLY